MFITFKDLQGMFSWGIALAILLFLVGFFPLAVPIGVGALWLLTAWRATQ